MKVIIDLENELTPEELASFTRQASTAKRSITDHVRALLFGDRELKMPPHLRGIKRSNFATTADTANAGN